MKGGLFIGPAAAFERAGFDYLLVEDTSMIEDAHGGSMEPMLYTIDGTACWVVSCFLTQGTPEPIAAR